MNPIVQLSKQDAREPIKWTINERETIVNFGEYLENQCEETTILISNRQGKLYPFSKLFWDNSTIRSLSFPGNILV